MNTDRAKGWEWFRGGLRFRGESADNDATIQSFALSVFKF
mgnify:CR=1 FL=1